MEIGNNNNALNKDKLHKLFHEYYLGLDKILNGLIQKSISTKEISAIFKNVDKKKLQIKGLKRRWFF